MRYLTSTIAAFTLAGTAGLFAQQQTPAPPSPSPPSASQAQPSEAPPAAAERPKSTLTGCVMQAKTTDGGTAYVLNKAQGGTATLYVLGGSQTPQDWASNVNKKVEVVGPVQEPAGASAAADAKVLRPPLVVVETVRVVSETCQ